MNSHSGNPGNQYTSDFHGGVPPSPVSSAPAFAPGMRLRAGHNPSGNPNVRRPGTFGTGNWHIDGGTSHQTRPAAAL